MEFALARCSLDACPTPALALLLPAGERTLHGQSADADRLSGGRVSSVLAGGDFRGKTGEVLVVYTPGAPFERVLLAGVGTPGKVTLENLRDAAGRAALHARDMGLASLTLALSAPGTLPWRKGLKVPTVAEVVRAIAEGVMLSQFQLTTFRTQDLDDVKKLGAVTLVLPTELSMDGLDEAVGTARAVAESIAIARTWILYPGEDLTPVRFAEEAQKAADAAGLVVTILDEDELKKQGFRTLLAVGQGSIHESRVIRVEWRGGAPDEAPIAIVGKGITFDTGGIGIKPPAGMEKMKYDMAGGAAAIGIVLACARLKLPQNVVAIVAAAENMPSGSAIQPGDVVTSFAGPTIEINDTDAEGRLVLADALAYAATLKPKAIVDMATLTGSVAVALGRRVMGVMGNDQAFIDRFLAIAEHAGERGWQLPLLEEYEENLESHIADMKNYGGRYGDTVNAGTLLRHFVGEIPWLHLDIAGAGWADEDRGYRPKGPTGIPLRAVVDLIAHWNS